MANVVPVVFFFYIKTFHLLCLIMFFTKTCYDAIIIKFDAYFL